MPLLRAAHGHAQAEHLLKQGDLSVLATGDTRAFRSRAYDPVRRRRESRVLKYLGGHIAPGQHHLEGDLLAFRCSAERFPSPRTGTAVLLLCLTLLLSIFSAVFYVAGDWWGMPLAFIGVPTMLVATRAIWPRVCFAIFDRRRCLVHLPSLLPNRRMDALRWKDLDVVVLDLWVRTGYRVPTYHPFVGIFLAKPGRSLERGEYPPPNGRVELLDILRPSSEDTTEQTWRIISSFMEEAPSQNIESTEGTNRDRRVVMERYGGDWAIMRWKESRAFRRLYGLELLTEPNWVRDETGQWHERPASAQERIAPPDDPTEKRVPV